MVLWLTTNAEEVLVARYSSTALIHECLQVVNGTNL